MFREFDIKKLMRKYRLPKGVKNIVVNRDELASGLNKSTVMIDRYRKGGMPVLTAGGSGTSYEFQLHDCWAWYHGMKDSEVAIKNEAQQTMDLLRRALVGGDDDDAIALTPLQRAQEYEAMTKYQAAALMQGTLTRSAEMTMLLEGVFGILRRQILSLPDVMERRVGLSPEQSETMEIVAKETLASVHGALSKSNLAIVLGDEKPAKRRKAR